MSDRSGQHSGQAGLPSAVANIMSTGEEQPAGVLAQAARLAKEGNHRGRQLVR